MDEIGAAAGVNPQASTKRGQNREGDIFEGDWPATHADKDDFEQQSGQENTEENKKRSMHRLSDVFPASKADKAPSGEKDERIEDVLVTFQFDCFGTAEELGKARAGIEPINAALFLPINVKGEIGTIEGEEEVSRLMRRKYARSGPSHGPSIHGKRIAKPEDQAGALLPKFEVHRPGGM